MLISFRRDVENYQQIRFDKTQYNDGDQTDDLERLQVGIHHLKFWDF